MGVRVTRITRVYVYIGKNGLLVHAEIGGNFCERGISKGGYEME